jgi:Tfp pilus assembly protein PilN
MEQRFWIMFIVVALALGLILGFGSGWKMKMAEVAELQVKIQQLTQENAGLKSRLASPAAPAGTTGQPGTTPAGGSGEKK